MRTTPKKNKSRKKSLALLDDLTGLYNRRYLKRVRKEIEAFPKRYTPFSVVMVDIDYFKEINDTYGHIKGDEVITEFSRFLKKTLRKTDTVVRYGGDEFVCVMPETERKNAQQIYTRILDMVKKKKFSDLNITISAGIGSYPSDGEKFDELLMVADEALYDAKRSGRGRIGAIRKKKIELPTKIYIGRKREKEILKNFLAESNNYVRVVIIDGNVGIGKTRLIREILSAISGREILWSDCLAFFDGIPYYPIREIIKYKIRRRGKDIIEDIPFAYRVELGKLVPEIMDEVKEQVKKVELVLDKYRLYESVKRIIELGKKDKIIVIDNMQWSDRETTELIKYLLRSLKDSPTTFIFIYRQEEKTNVLDDFTSYISRETETKKMSLGSFKHNETSAMIKLIIGEEPNKQLVRYLEHESGGNPFYIEEILKELNDAGYLRVEDDTWKFESPDAEIIPKSIEDITERKYQALSKEGKEIIEIASVIGWFDIGIIQAITGYNEGHIIGVIGKIKHLGLIRERGERIVFQEEISRDALYRRHISDMKARMLHKQVGEQIEAQYQGREEEVVETLALHFYRGDEHERGVRYCLEAGDRAREKYANDSALQYYNWVEELLQEATDKKSIGAKIDCLLKRAEVLRFIGNNEAALKDLEGGLSIVQNIKDVKREADIRFKKATVHTNIAQYDKAINEVNKCTSLYKVINDKKGIASVFNALGKIHSLLGEYEKALEFNNTSLRFCRELNHKVEEARVINHIGIAHSNLGDFNKALKYYKDSLNIARTIGNPAIEAALLNNIGTVHKNLGNYYRALKNYEDSLHLSKEIGDRYGTAIVLNNIGRIHLDRGNFKSALKLFEESLRIARNIDDKINEALILLNIGTIYTNMGEYTTARKYFETSLNMGKTIRSRNTEFYSLYNLADLNFKLNKKKRAKGMIDKAQRIAQSTHSKKMLSAVLSMLSLYYLEKNEPRKFEVCMEKFQKTSADLKSKDFEGEIHLLLGRYYTQTKDFNKAQKHFDDTLKIVVEIESHLVIGVVYYYMAMMELTRGKKLEYRKLLKNALEIFTTLGAHAWEKKTIKVLKKRR